MRHRLMVPYLLTDILLPVLFKNIMKNQFIRFIIQVTYEFYFRRKAFAQDTG
jgi:hypothetical protein